MKIILLILIYLAFISLGLPDSLLGSGWPAISKDFNIPTSYMGFISMAIAGCTIISSLFSSKLNKKISTQTITIVSIFLTVIGLFGFYFSSNFYFLILSAIPYGLGAGAIDSCLNNYVALHYKARHMSWLHCFWGVGTIISPFIMGYALTSSNWHNGYLIVGFIQIAIALILLFTVPVWKINKPLTEERTVSAGIIKTIKLKGVPFVLIAFFAYCALEATTMGWASTYFSEVKNISLDGAAQFASLFYIGITASRFLSGFISDKLGDHKLILLGISILTIGIILLFIPNSNIVSIIAFIIIGFGCGPIYPSIIHLVPINFPKEYSGTLIGLEMSCAYVGTTFMPPLFGYLGNSIGFNIMPIYLLIFAILLLIFIEIMFRLTKKNTSNN